MSKGRKSHKNCLREKQHSHHFGAAVTTHFGGGSDSWQKRRKREMGVFFFFWGANHLLSLIQLVHRRLLSTTIILWKHKRQKKPLHLTSLSHMPKSRKELHGQNCIRSQRNPTNTTTYSMPQALATTRSAKTNHPIPKNRTPNPRNYHTVHPIGGEKMSDSNCKVTHLQRYRWERLQIYIYSSYSNWLLPADWMHGKDWRYLFYIDGEEGEALDSFCAK